MADRYAVKEDRQMEIIGVSVADDDIEEDIISTLALWMADPQYTGFVKKLQVSVQVAKGTLYFPVLTNLAILRTFTTFFLTITTRYPMHDLCRQRTMVANPGAT